MFLKPLTHCFQKGCHNSHFISRYLVFYHFQCKSYSPPRSEPHCVLLDLIYTADLRLNPHLPPTGSLRKHCRSLGDQRWSATRKGLTRLGGRAAAPPPGKYLLSTRNTQETETARTARPALGQHTEGRKASAHGEAAGVPLCSTSVLCSFSVCHVGAIKLPNSN